MQKKKASKLLEVNHAVESYLDNLLQEATESSVNIQQKSKPIAKKSEKLKVAVDTEAATVHILDTPLTVRPDNVDLHELELKIEQEQTTLQWPLQCLMFKVNGKLLSIPLIKMGNVVPWGERLTQLPQSPPHVKGILNHYDHNIKVVDTALLFGDILENSTFSPSHLLIFENYEWAISCDQLLDVITIQEQDIKWHDPKLGKMTYGTIKDNLAQLINPGALSKKLSTWSKTKNSTEIDK